MIYLGLLCGNWAQQSSSAAAASDRSMRSVSPHQLPCAFDVGKNHYSCGSCQPQLKVGLKSNSVNRNNDASALPVQTNTKISVNPKALSPRVRPWRTFCATNANVGRKNKSWAVLQIHWPSLVLSTGNCALRICTIQRANSKKLTATKLCCTSSSAMQIWIKLETKSAGSARDSLRNLSWCCQSTERASPSGTSEIFWIQMSGSSVKSITSSGSIFCSAIFK